ncbi:erlin-2 [Eurytemora carolleeae]|uniref:erlin-2 n=1 Tax=Eurytemora carolleeae TaxID=1294199 RepID=UPI000C76F0AB|nr:erlin-2 [Eurytemora carolleeae]|eukprot:XP_023335671.1 erlin-2-like [Eurytemora affinis]
MVNEDDVEQPERSETLAESYKRTGKKCIALIIIINVVAITAILLSSIHKIEEGNVGIYFKNGALMEETTQPGIHHMTPFIVNMVEIQTRPQTDHLPTIVSVTRDGIENTFKDIQVISRVRQEKLVPLVRKFGIKFRESLIFDRVKEELRIFCANNSIDDVYNTKFLEIVANVRTNLINSIERLGEGGIEILNLVISKPDIPEDIAQNYKQVKVQWTEQLVATQMQKTEQIKKEIEMIKAIADAERNKAVLEITIQQRILEKEGERNVSSLENLIKKEKEENLANIEMYRIEKEAEANTKLYTEPYIKLNLAKQLSSNTKFYFSGETSPLGAIFEKIIGSKSE